MKAGHFNRKTHLKKHAVLPDDLQITLVDAAYDDGSAFLSLADQESHQSLSYDDIIALPYAFTSEEDILSWCLAILRESPVGKRLLEDAADDGWAIGLADLHNGGFYLDIPEKRFLVDHFSLAPSALGRSLYFRNALVITVIRALRDIWHEKRIDTPCEENYAPEDILMLERVRAADGDAVTVLACWELRGAGFTDIWRHLLGSEEGDMAMVFTRVLERDPSALYNGTALSYAFRQWYADQNRVDGCDHETLESLDDLLMVTEEANPFGCRELRAIELERLSCLPDGTGYLQGMGPTILNDPFFAGLHDPINQTHLFHLIHDLEATTVHNVPFRDSELAHLIFPDGNRDIDFS